MQMEMNLLPKENEYGVIQNFSLVNYDQSDFIYFSGFNYKIKNNIYANIQYNWWGENLNDSTFYDFNYRRLLFIFSVNMRTIKHIIFFCLLFFFNGCTKDDVEGP